MFGSVITKQAKVSNVDKSHLDAIESLLTPSKGSWRHHIEIAAPPSRRWRHQSVAFLSLKTLKIENLLPFPEEDVEEEVDEEFGKLEVAVEPEVM